MPPPPAPAAAAATTWESIFELPAKESQAKFMEKREEHFLKLEEEVQMQRKEVQTFATMAHKRVQQVREVDRRLKACYCDNNFIFLRRHAIVNTHFPNLKTIIPEHYPSNSSISKEWLDQHLESLDTAIQEALDEAERVFHHELEKLALRGGPS